MARRFLASVMLASVTVAFAPPPLLHEHASSQDCHRGVGAHAVVTVTKAPSGGCEQMSGPACTLMVACASVAPAVLSASPLVAIPTTHGVVAVASRSTLHGRLALGPPTPPPNS
jgi:hypothetical protein